MYLQVVAVSMPRDALRVGTKLARLSHVATSLLKTHVTCVWLGGWARSMPRFALWGKTFMWCSQCCVSCLVGGWVSVHTHTVYVCRATVVDADAILDSSSAARPQSTSFMTDACQAVVSSVPAASSSLRGFVVAVIFVIIVLQACWGSACFWSGVCCARWCRSCRKRREITLPSGAVVTVPAYGTVGGCGGRPDNPRRCRRLGWPGTQAWFRRP